MPRIQNLVLALATLSPLSPLSAASLTLDTSNGADYAGIRSAIYAAASGDTVHVEGMDPTSALQNDERFTGIGGRMLLKAAGGPEGSTLGVLRVEPAAARRAERWRSRIAAGAEPAAMGKRTQRRSLRLFGRFSEGG